MLKRMVHRAIVLMLWIAAGAFCFLAVYSLVFSSRLVGGRTFASDVVTGGMTLLSIGVALAAKRHRAWAHGDLKRRRTVPPALRFVWIMALGLVLLVALVV